MDRNQAKQFYPILQAYAEGKVIECRTKSSFIEGTDVPNEWAEIKVIEFNDNKEYRIKPNLEPESEYRPFKDAIECWTEMLKHQPIGWVHYNGYYTNIAAVMRTAVVLANNKGRNFTFEQAFEECTLIDGHPFGVKMNE